MLEASLLTNVQFVATTAVILAVPGPTNAFLAAAGAAQGIRSSLKLAPAVLFAYLGAILAWGCLLTPAAAAWPPLTPLMRLGCSLFLAVTALRLWQGTIGLAANPGSAVTVRTVTLATLLNPKAVLFATGIYPAEAFTQADIFHSTAVAFGSLLIPIALGWICFGASLGGAGSRISPQTIHRTAAILLAFFSATIGVSAVI